VNDGSQRVFLVENALEAEAKAEIERMNPKGKIEHY
jgi:hypothetical protein